MEYFIVFKILIIFYSIDVIHCIYDYWVFMEDKEISQNVLIVFGLYAISLTVSVFWNTGAVFSKLIRSVWLEDSIWNCTCSSSFSL